MIQNIPTNVINYVDNKGNLIKNKLISKIQIRSEDDLPLLTTCGIGTRAYLANESKTWVLGSDGEWREVVNGASEDKVVIHAVYNEELDRTELDKTWKEIYDLFVNNNNVIVNYVISDYDEQGQPLGESLILTMRHAEDFEVGPYILFLDNERFFAENENDYPQTNY